MQSTVRPLAPSEMSDKIQFLSNCLNETNFSESLESQSETAGRCNEIAAFTLMQQSRRMLQRPLSIAGVQVADGNRFFVNLGSQAETCARPLVINDTMFNRPTSNHQTSQSQTTQTTQLVRMDNLAQTPQSQTPHHQTLQHQTFHQETLQHKEELKMATATHTTPFAWDFRAQSNGVDAIGVDRSWDLPALDENSYRQPSSHSAKVWSKQPSLSRMPALVKSKNHPQQMQKACANFWTKP